MTREYNEQQMLYDADDLLQKLVTAREAAGDDVDNAGVRCSISSAIEERKSQLRD